MATKEIEEELNESKETQISTVDPDSRLMENKKNGLEMGYNLQIAADSKNKLILDFDVTKNPADQGNLNSMSQKAKEIRYKNYKACNKCEYRDKCTKSKKGRTITRSPYQDFLDRVDERTQENMDKYLQRQMIVEHPFGTIKRTMNAGYYLCRGTGSVISESSLIILAYNFKRLLNILGTKEFRRKIAELRANSPLNLLNKLKIANRHFNIIFVYY